MDLTKEKLIEKITKVHQFLVEFENLNIERANRFQCLENSKLNLKHYKKSRNSAIIMFIICSIIAVLLCNWRIGFIFFLIFAVLGLLLFIGNISDVKKCRNIINNCQKQFDEMDEKFKTFFSQNEQEINDANEFFPGDTYPLSRHIQYGLNGLTSGRADDFKEFMNLIDDLIHREKIEYQAQVQTENTRQQVEYAKQAAANSRAALNAANAAAYDARRAANANHTVYINRY